ncbi:hypothetical protein DFH09DRAFT_159175 [Mycena vulgaris]|nr:hypothetical protein DFH09DRAFT_159175 [Mycena vulgaris]
MLHPTGILDLPTEILVDILENPTFPTNTLYALALLSRRLHFIALPIYFSRHGMPSTPNSVVITMQTDRKDLLSALQIALFIPQIDSIACIFPHPSCTSIFPILPHLRRLESLIARLSSVKHVTLQLDTMGSICLSVGDDQALRGWTSHLESLLNCIVEKRCSSLTMVHGGQFTRAYELSPPAPCGRWTRRGLFASLLRLCSRDMPAPEFMRVSRQGQSCVEMNMPSSVSRSSHLTSLDIQSAILILPPGLHWTLAALRHCHTIPLTLGLLSVEANTWTTVLPLIASAGPNLTTIVLQGAETVPDGDILAFLSQLPLLTDVIIASKNPTSIYPYGTPIIPFRHLEQLRAPPNFIQHFLRHHPACFPQIKYICISWPIHPPSIDVVVLCALIASIISRLDARGLAPELSVSLDTMMYRYAFTSNGLNDDLRKCLDRIQALEIRVLPFFFTDVGEMGSWIAIFRSVRRVDITLLNSRPADIRLDVGRLVKAIKPTDFLDRISVNGEVYQLVKP